jgi:TonB-dependent receptor
MTTLERITTRFFRKKIMAFFTFLLLTGSLFAQTGSLHGVVKDVSEGQLLPGANVYLPGPGMGTVTNMEGEYRIQNIPVGEYTVEVSYIGYIKQNKEITISEGESHQLDFDLQYDAVNIDEVVVTAQLFGQAQAVNRQLTSDAMVNVVSSDKMKELPDVNAAEAIGRLPGISVQRTGGEASKVVIRGLSPKLTAVTINGVRVPPTSGSDRSVDLSIISPELLSNVEVYKSPTADMDGDAIGGIINLGVMKAPNKPRASFQLNGGYNGLDREFSNYKAILDASRRFFDNRLGVLLKGNFENINRSSESIGNNYDWNQDWAITESSFTDQRRILQRIGATAGLDFSYNTGEVKVQGFYSQRNLDNQVNSIELQEATMIDYGPRHTKDKTSVYQATLSGKQRFAFVEADYLLSASNTNADNYYDIEVTINEYNGQEVVGPVYTTEDKLGQRTYNDESAWLRNTGWRPEQTLQSNYTAALNLKMDYNLPGRLSGFLKFGGKYRRDQRDRSVDHYYIFKYYLDDNLNDQAVENMLPYQTDIGGNSGRRIMLSNFVSGSDRVDLWNGQYSLYPLIDMEYLDLWAEKQKNTLLNRPDNETLYRNYEVMESVSAAYIMTKINYGKLINIIPGVRYEYSDNEYWGYISSLSNDNTGSIWDTTTYKSYGVLLPSLHVKIKPLNWFDIRMSAVKTLSRPDYSMITPRARLDLGNANLYRGNPDLKHADAWNFDAMFSFFANKLGLFTIGGFYKHFDNYFTETNRVMSAEEAATLGYPVQVYEVEEDYINFDDSEVYGFEIDLQTNFNYLPAPFNGIVLNANVSRLWSKTFLPLYFKVTRYDPALRRNVLDHEASYYEFKETSLPDQTEWISNLSIGYDFKGFSARVSMIYQSTYLSGFGSAGEASAQSELTDRYTDAFLRFDASVTQRIGEHIRILANFTNITAESERSYQYKPQYWRDENRYGTTFDLGIRYEF